MSSLAYGIVTAKRAAAPANTSQTTSAPAVGTYIDALAALVPAEALALYAFVIQFTTHTASVHGKKITTISNPALLGWSCAGLLVLSSLLYAVGRKRTNLDHWDILRFFIPPMAFTAWMLLAKPSIWDIWWSGSSGGERAIIAAFAAVVLGILAGRLGYQADQTPGVLAVTGVSPNSGPLTGGQTVTVSGTGFTGATGVQFGEVAAPTMAVATGSDTTLTATSPAGTAGTVDVTVTTPSGTSATTPDDHYTYAAATAPPTVTGVNPNSGPVAGGQTVTVTGTGFTGATKVSFGTTAALNLTVSGDTTLTATSPPGTSGTVAVTVTTPSGTSATTANDHYTYNAPPTVTGVSPNSGPVAGGQTVTVTGTGFTGATQVNFGTAAASGLVAASDTTLTVISPQVTAAGPVDVRVTTPTGTSAATAADQFTYN